MAYNICFTFVLLLFRDLHFVLTFESEAVAELKYVNK